MCVRGGGGCKVESNQKLAATALCLLAESSLCEKTPKVRKAALGF